MKLKLSALILAGGSGTRFKGTLADLPKPPAPISGYSIEQESFQTAAKRDFS